MIEELKMNQSKLESDLDQCESSESDLVASQQKTEELNRIYQELILAYKKNQTKLVFEIENYKSTDAELVISQRELNVCQKKYELVCPWTEWSSCSKTSCGSKIRTGKCSSIDEQIKACNQDSSCPSSGK